MLVEFLHRIVLVLVVVHAVVAASSSYESPSKNGGSMLTKQKEPLNEKNTVTSDEKLMNENIYED